MRTCTSLLLVWAVAVQAVPAQDLKLTARLLGPISTETSRKGDRITAQVVDPEQYKGDIMEGVITESKNGGSVKGTSVLTFRFDTWHRAGQPLPVQASVESFTNSKGQPDVDEEGRAIKRTNRIGAALGVAALGAAIGAMAGGARGAAIGAGAGAAASLLFIKFAAKGPRINFGPETNFVLSVQPARGR